MTPTAVDGVDAALQQLLDRSGFTDVVSGARAIADEPLHPGERALFLDVDVRTRRATSTGRALARQLLQHLGISAGPILRSTGGQPTWPTGIVGSIAHDDDVAVCVVSRGGVVLGVDVEPALPLPAEIKNDVAITAIERAAVGDDLVAARLLFCAKEAVFKACFPIEGVFFEHADVQLQTRGALSLTASTALFTTSTKRTVQVAMTRTPRLIALAHIVVRSGA